MAATFYLGDELTVPHVTVGITLIAFQNDIISQGLTAAYRAYSGLQEVYRP